MNTHGDEHFHAAMASPTRRRVLDVVAATDEGVDAATIATRLHLHVTTVRFHLDQLESVSLVARRVAGEKRRGRPRVLYVAAHEGRRNRDTAQARDTARDTARVPGAQEAAAPASAVEERSRAQLIEVLAAALAAQAAQDGDRGRGAAIAAGRAWGSRAGGGIAGAGETVDAARTAVLLSTLDDLGFAPERRGNDVALHGCPFREAAREHPHIVCAAHLGLIREIMNDQSDAVQLFPMVQPGLCVVAMPDTSALPVNSAMPDRRAALQHSVGARAV